MGKERAKKNGKGDVLNMVQFFEIVFVMMIIFLIAVNDFFILDVHVFFSTVGWMLMMVQGLLVFRGINPVIRKLLGKDTVFIHWVMETVALIGATLGLINVYKFKVDMNWQHFVTLHAILGLAGISFSILSGLNGIPTLYRKELKNYISPNWMKFIHIVTGTIGFFFGGLSLIMACYTKWFASKTTNSLMSFCVAIFLVTSVVGYTLIRPVDKIRSNWKKLTSAD